MSLEQKDKMQTISMFFIWPGFFGGYYFSVSPTPHIAYLFVAMFVIGAFLWCISYEKVFRAAMKRDAHGKQFLVPRVFIDHLDKTYGSYRIMKIKKNTEYDVEFVLNIKNDGIRRINLVWEN